MNLDKQSVEMPLVAAMLKYKNEDVYPLHTPGHKGGRGMERLLRQELGASVAMDVSLMSELDDSRRAQLLLFIDGRVQTFITVNDRELIPNLAGNAYFRIENGSINEA